MEVGEEQKVEGTFEEPEFLAEINKRKLFLNIA